MKQFVILILLITCQVTVCAQKEIKRKQSKYYINDNEWLEKKDVKNILLDIDDESINKHVKSYNDLKVAGYVLSGMSVIFGAIAIKKSSTEEDYLLATIPVVTFEENPVPYYFASFWSLAGGVVLFAFSNKHLKKAVEKYNKIVITPTSNGVGLVYRF